MRGTEAGIFDPWETGSRQVRGCDAGRFDVTSNTIAPDVIGILHNNKNKFRLAKVQLEKER